MAASDIDRRRWEDLILARRCATDPPDEDAWRDLVGRYQSLLWWRAAQVLPIEIRHEVDDVVQEVFLRFRKAAVKYDAATASLATFLVVLARSTARDWERRRRMERSRTVGPLDEANPSQATGPDADPARLLSEGRRRLDIIRNPRKRQIFQAFLDLQTPDQVHASLNTPLSTAYRLYEEFREWLTALSGSVIPG